MPLDAPMLKFCAPMARDKLIQAYADADLLFLHLNSPSVFHKRLPAKIFEYAATGKPILAGTSGYAAEFIESEVTHAWVFPPCDCEQALKCIASLNFSLEDRNRFIEKYQQDTMIQLLASDLLSYC